MNKYKTFEQWMKAVDAAISNEIGLDSRDLPDCCYRDWYDDGYTVKSAAKSAIQNANE